ncbi:cell division FtsK/SpoIIIE domain protein [Burkholderia cenocepacia]|nr:cell division FtsK/SpoIIIE domain protein [Burkholderia cenocepacia]
MPGCNNRPSRSRRRRACTTRCARSKPVPRNGRRSMAHDRVTGRRQRLALRLRARPLRRLQQAAWPRRHRLPRRERWFPVKLQSHSAMQPAIRTRTKPHRRHTTTIRSCSTRSCQAAKTCACRSSILARRRSPTPRSPRRRISASKPTRRPIMQTSCQSPRRQSTRRSILHRGKTPPAGRLPASMRRTPLSRLIPSHRPKRRAARTKLRTA